jgi:hypothetical protein
LVHQSNLLSHWGLLITSIATSGRYFHATNKSGGWILEVKLSSDPMSLMSLVLVQKLGEASSPDQMYKALQGVPADGSPSLRTGEPFTCRISLKDAVMALHKNGLLDLIADIGESTSLRTACIIY